MLQVNARIRIPDAEFHFHFVRSGGPGGQNVNKVASKAQLRWSVATSPSLPPDVRARFLERYASRITSSGELLLASQRFRDQARNAADCLDKLRTMLTAVATAPRKRKATRPTRSSQENRLEKKQRTAAKKQSRGRRDWDAS